MKIFRNRKTAKTNFTGRKTTKMRFFILASIFLAAISSTVAFSSITTASALGNFLFGEAFLGQSLLKAVIQDDTKKGAKSSRLMQLAPDSLVSELAAARSGHTATRLDGEKVLITGGDAGGTAEIFDAATGTSSATGNLNAARSGHMATILADGRVLVLGGTSYGAVVASTEIFDASTGTFSAGAMMNAARSGHTATVLEDGKILIAGGDLVGSAEIFDPADGTFTSISTMTASRAGHSAVLLKDGGVLLVGGSDAEGNELKSAEIFDSATLTFFATGNEMAHHRTNALLRVLPDGKVQIIGGNDDLSMEVYDPAIDTIGAHAHLIPTGDEHDALLQSDLLSAPSRSAMFHNGQTDALFDRSNFTVTELGSQALVAGGANTSGTSLSSLTVLDSSSATVTTDKLDYQPGQTAVISGTGWQAGETVNIILHEDPHTTTERRLTTQADANGNFSGNYLVEERDLNVTFIIGAKGASSSRTAQTTFTDAASISVTWNESALTMNVTTNGLTGSKNYRIDYESPIGNITSSTVFTGTNGPNSTQSSNILSNPYRVGTWTIRLMIEGNGSSAGTYSLDKSTTLNVTATNRKLAFSTIPSSTNVNEQSGWQVQRQNGAGIGYIDGTSLTVAESTTSGTGQFRQTENSINPNSSGLIGTTSSQRSFYYIDTTAGTYTITAKATGHTDASTSYTINSVAVATDLTVSPASGTYGGTTDLTATLTQTSSGAAVSGKTISFTLNGNSVGTETTNASGVATLSNVNLSGINAGTYPNYVAASFAGDSGFITKSGNGSLTVSQKTLTPTITANNKMYNGTTTATLSAQGFAVGEVVGSDDVTLTVGSANFDTKDAGTGKTVTATGLGLFGNSKDNYALSSTTATTTANITAAAPTVTITGGTFPYDGSTHPATATATGIGGETVSGSFIFTYTPPGDATVPVDAGSYSASALFTSSNTNYADASSSTPATITIDPVNSETVVTVSNAVYDGDSHGGSAVVTGANNFSQNLTVYYEGRSGTTYASTTTVPTNAGDYTASASFAGNQNYNSSQDSKDFSITKKPTTVSGLSPQSLTYGDSIAQTAAVDSGAGGETIVYTLASGHDAVSGFGTYSNPVNVGSYTLKAVFAGNGNYEGAEATANITIEKAGQEITFNPLDGKTFGDAPFSVNATGGNSGNPVTFGATGNCTSTGINGTTITITGAGSCTVTASQAGNDNFNAATDIPQGFVIDKATATLTLTAADLNQTYNNSPRTVGYSIDPNVGVVTVTYDRSNVAPTNAGSYAVAASLSNDNYQATDAAGTLIISPASQEITFAPLGDKTFGDADFTVSATADSGLAVSFSPGGNCSMPDITTVHITGAGSCTITASQGGNDNYEAANSVSQSFNIGKASATVTLDNLGHTYDGAAKSATALTNPSGLNVNFAYSRNGITASPITAESYDVTATIDDANYEGGAIGVLVIGKATPTVSFTSTAPETLVYQGTYTPTAETDGDGAVSIGASGACSISSGIVTMDSGIGVCTVSASSAETSNYFGASATSQTINAEKAGQMITFTGAPTSAEFNTGFTVVATATSGLSVSISSTGACSNSGTSVTMTSGTGTCNLTASQGGDDNYKAADEKTQTTTAEKASASINLDGLTQTYNGTARIVTATTTPDALSGVSITYDGSTTAPTEAGSYSIAASLSNNDYQATNATGTLVVGKAAQMITWTIPAAISYGTALSDTQLNATVEGLEGGSAPGALSYTPAAGTIPGAGSQTLKVTAAATSNYEEATKEVTIQVDKVALIVTAEDQTKVYGSMNPTLTYKYSGFVNEQTLSNSGVTGSPNCATTAIQSSPVLDGPYPINCAIGTLTSNNYTINFVAGNLSVTPAPLTVKADDKSRVYGDPNPTFTAAFTGFVLGQNATALGGTLGFNTDADATSPVSPPTYSITPNSLTSSNYAITFVGGTLTVTKRLTRVTFVGPKTAIYGTCIEYSAKLEDIGNGSTTAINNATPIVGATLTLQVGSQSATAVTGTGGVAKVFLSAVNNIGTTTAGTSFIGDSIHLGSADSINNFSITSGSVAPLNSQGFYTGESIFWTTGTSSSTATLTLSATIQDSTSTCAGDIRTARVTFAIRNADNSYTPINGASNLPVGLANPGDLKVGTATAVVQYNLGNANAETLNVAIIVSGNYTNNNPATDTIVSVAKPITGQILGSGLSANTNSRGFIAGAFDEVTNFGFNVKYNKSGTNPQGKASFIIRSYYKSNGLLDTVLHTYDVKSNSITSMSVVKNTATFSSKANITEQISNSDGTTTNVSVDSGTILQLAMTDGSPDKLAITVQNSKGGLWFSNNWNGTKTLEQLLTGDLISVR